jgi:hypothetical protein
MAFGQGKVSSEGASNFKKYVGVASVKVLAVNPTMEEWNKITGGNMQKEPEYISTNNEGVKQARITLLVQTDPKKTVGDIDTIIPVTFWFRKLPVQGSQSGKYQIIDKYGRTAWATEEEVKNKAIPQYANGPANIDADYRRVVAGEEAFTNFLKAHLNIPAVSYTDRNGNVVKHPNSSECEARLDNIMKIFDGNFKEIKTILGYQKDNYSKMLFGVKTTEDGKEFQDVFMECFLTNGNPNNARFAKVLKDFINGGRQAYNNTYFGELNPNGELIVSELKERVLAPSTFTESDSTIPSTPLSSAAAAMQPEDDLPF